MPGWWLKFLPCEHVIVIYDLLIYHPEVPFKLNYIQGGFFFNGETFENILKNCRVTGFDILGGCQKFDFLLVLFNCTLRI